MLYNLQRPLNVLYFYGNDISYIENAYAFSDCRFNIRNDGAVLMNFLDIPMNTPTRQKIGLYFCAERGTMMGGNPIAREKAFLFISSGVEGLTTEPAEPFPKDVPPLQAANNNKKKPNKIYFLISYVLPAAVAFPK